MWHGRNRSVVASLQQVWRARNRLRELAGGRATICSRVRIQYGNVLSYANYLDRRQRRQSAREYYRVRLRLRLGRSRRVWLRQRRIPQSVSQLPTQPTSPQALGTPGAGGGCDLCVLAWSSRETLSENPMGMERMFVGAPRRPLAASRNDDSPQEGKGGPEGVRGF